MGSNGDDAPHHVTGPESIPITEAQWESCLRAIRAPVRDLIEHDDQNLGKTMQAFVLDLSRLSWFTCVDQETSLQLREMALEMDKRDSADIPKSKEFHTLVDRCAELSNGEFSTDVWKDAFDVPRAELLDPEGAVLSARLLAHFYLRPKDLGQAAASVLFIAGVSPEPTFSVHIASTIVGLLESPNPLVTLRALYEVRGHLDALGDEVMDRLSAYVSRAEQSSNSSASFNALVRMAESTADARASMTWLLEGYRKIAEGRLRSWLWMLLAPSGAEAVSLPMLGSLERRLATHDRLEVRGFSSFLKPAWRNATAHEDLLFDEADELYIDDLIVTRKEVEACIADALAFDAGCQIALLVRAPSRPLRSPEPPVIVPRAHQLIRAREWFGDNGLAINAVHFDKRVLQAAVSGLNVQQLDPSLQAILLSQLDGVTFDRAEVWVEGQSVPAVVVSPDSIDRTVPLWKYVRTFVRKNPGSTFIPMTFENRRRVESASAAAEAVTWLVLNDVLAAFDTGYNLYVGELGPDADALATIQRRTGPVDVGIAVHKYLLYRLKLASLAYEATVKAEPNAFYRPDVVRTVLARQLAEVGHFLRVDPVAPRARKEVLALRDSVKRPAPAPNLGIYSWEGLE